MDVLEDLSLFEPIDSYFAKRLLTSFPDLSRDVEIFLSVLMAFSRRGHVCVNIQNGRLEPSLDSLISDPGKRKNIEKKAIAGASALPAELVEETNTHRQKRKPIFRFHTRYYLQKNWEFETSFLYHIQRVLVDKHTETLTLGPIETLNAEQNDALQLALNNSFTLITGGPGTGKTYTASHIVAEYLKRLSQEQKKKAKIYLAAPTGKAAAHLKKNLLKHLGEGNFFCGTLHRLLNLKGKRDFIEGRTQLFADLILIDECSMIDAHLFSLLLSSLKIGTKIILMGDKNQLPPVDSGSFFADLIDLAIEKVPLALAELTVCMRSDKQPLLQLAHSVQNGDVEEAMRQVARFKNDQSPLFQKNPKEGYAHLWEGVKEHFLSIGDELKSPALLLQKSEKFRILSSLRKGPFGVEALNEFIAHRVWEEKSKREDKVAFPILLTRSDHSLNLSNGESGVLVCRPNTAFAQDDFVLFLDEGGGIRQLPAAILPSFEYAFCLSVHKSQGSEFDDVLLLIPPGTEAFGREVLYTAITRARRKLFIQGDDSIIRQAIAYSSRKVSGLKERLKIRMMQIN